jgi:hypothetical protein
MVGLVGSFIKDSVKENTGGSIINAIRALPKQLADLPSPEPVKSPELTNVLLGTSVFHFSASRLATEDALKQASSSCCSLKFCKFLRNGIFLDNVTYFG